MSSEELAPTVRRGTAGVLPWYAAMASLAVAFIACYVFFVRTRLGQWIDDAALLGGQAFLAAYATRKPALAFLDYMPAFSAVLSGAVLLWALVRRRDFVRPAIAGLSILGASGTTQLLKHVVLERPDLNISGATVNSFPSGHTTFAAAAMMSIFLVSPAARRPMVALGGWAYAAVAGASTLVLGWHRPSDVVAAYLVAAFWTMLAGLVLRHLHGPTEPAGSAGLPRSGSSERILAWCASAGTIALSAGLVLALLLPHPRIGDVSDPVLLVFLGAGLALILGSAFLIGHVVLRLFSRYGAPIRFNPDLGMK
ncbi:phosphatase PAP2 family protein [Paeniglutamicibacter kerguelensis]|uniref:Membrane-associated phospholipid phosphatase n=1 Tax=Paeniglutamicibacter kerguelensis TaxID=254788 RepID=A0ABS4XEZ0_9MICC|nr:phosphatase PAP2 family protein [Paeniglutamicibacter kerguelensis]MBP2387030.1 membrane-associated phospholipid phosphatase [Paeniglutamicibacter kerguelensis]